MTLKPSDMMEIQSAIDEYEKKYPRRPAPSAELALAWRLGRREAARRIRYEKQAASAPGHPSEPGSRIVQQECSRWVWAWEQVKLQWHMWRGTGPDVHQDSDAPGLPAWVQGALRLGWWGMVVAVSVTVFVFGALIGGLK